MTQMLSLVWLRMSDSALATCTVLVQVLVLAKKKKGTSHWGSEERRCPLSASKSPTCQVFFFSSSCSSSFSFLLQTPFSLFQCPFLFSSPLLFLPPPFTPGHFFPFRPMFHVPDGAGVTSTVQQWLHCYARLFLFLTTITVLGRRSYTGITSILRKADQLFLVVVGG